jgi:geranylgeranyl pyrophosphate synthase
MQAFTGVTQTEGLSSDAKLAITAILSRASGMSGLVGGQEIDLQGTTRLNDRSSLRDLNRRKTGALIVAAVETGLHVAAVDGQRAESMRVAADHIGEAFQTVDDLLDATANTEDVGKDVLKDRHKPTLIAIAGVAEARQEARNHMDRATSLIDDCAPKAQSLVPYLRTVLEPHLNA